MYAAERLDGGGAVALKLMHPELSASPEAVARFEREVAATRRVRHPGVVEVYEQGRLADGRPWFTMERLEGVSLKEHLERRGRLPLREVLEILGPLCGALSAAHALSIVHRDVKPSNVFLVRAGGPAAEADAAAHRVVLLDFGVAKLLDLEGAGLTSSRHVIGSLSCMAPEQILGKAVDARTDVYALGVLVYQMLVGEMPFSGRTALALQQMHLYTAPRSPSLVAPLDPALNTPILRALAKEAAARQPSAGAFFAELVAAGVSRVGAQRRALAVLVEVHADEGALDEPDDGLLDDLEAVLPASAGALGRVGLRPSLETGTSVLLSAARPDDAALDVQLRAGVVEALAALWGRLAARPGRDARVHVRICLHAGVAEISAEGEMTGGDLMKLSSWVPEPGTEGVLASDAAVEGLRAGAAGAAGAVGEVEEVGEVGAVQGVRWLLLAPGQR
ncbi:serine/threonine protein kinase [Chondromyces apiculatus DSM 436]|uniref:Serine/threonine protein kinase n=1 Tax=Chondromyces apiculatus DSM 436 TaxID=1192034 RepID=A0A017T4B6_9BACT|nr:serine/threonine protein kinase [Chondromyces apiculatus DSM 436]